MAGVVWIIRCYVASKRVLRIEMDDSRDSRQPDWGGEAGRLELLSLSCCAGEIGAGRFFMMTLPLFPWQFGLKLGAKPMPQAGANAPC